MLFRSTWFDDHTSALKFGPSSDDGENFNPPHTLASTDKLVLDASTTDRVLAGPYTLVVPGAPGLRALWQVRSPSLNGEISKVFVGDLVENSAGQTLGNEDIEKFLPGAADVQRLLARIKCFPDCSDTQCGKLILHHQNDCSRVEPI